MLIGSWKSPLNSSDSSCARAFLAMTVSCQQNIASAGELGYLNLPSNACSTLMASLALVSKYGISPLELQKVAALLFEIWRTSVPIFQNRGIFRTYHSLALFDINLVAQDDLSTESAKGHIQPNGWLSYKGEVLRIPWRSLN